jgi:osmotically-inducible protein OsmY
MLLLASCTLLLTGCTEDDRAKTAAAGKADSSLEKTIEASFASEAQLQNAELSVIANADKSEAILAGTVSSEEARSKAIALAKEAKPGLKVIAVISVRPADVPRGDFSEVMARHARDKALVLGDKIGSSLDDAWLYTKVVTRLTTNSGAPALKINVDVSNQVVTLRGKVESEKVKDDAERIAQETDGVKRVNNLLKVGGIG